ncbi:MAG: NAD(P)H-quinone oxidoreductase [Nesterenkonia sp.]
MQVIHFVTPAGLAKPSKEEPAELVVAEVPRPVPEPHQVLIRVAASGINAADILQRAGNYPPPSGASEVPGLEISGTVEEAGSDAGDWELGTPVCALLAGGGYSEYVAVDARHVLPAPKTASLIEAGGLVEVAATCWANLYMQAQTRPGDWVLVHGGTGGIGQFAIQLLRATGAHPVVTVGSEGKAALARELGAHSVINYRSEDFVERVDEITGGHGVDVILDVVGAAYLEQNVKALAQSGRMVTIGTQGGAKGTLPFMHLMAKRAWVTGTFLRSRTAEEKADVIQQVHQHVWPLIEEGTIEVAVERAFGFDEAEAAYDFFSSAERTGKIVLTPGG